MLSVDDESAMSDPSCCPRDLGGSAKASGGRICGATNENEAADAIPEQPHLSPPKKRKKEVRRQLDFAYAASPLVGFTMLAMVPNHSL